MPLDPQVEAWLRQLKEAGLPPLNEMPLAQARQAYSDLVARSSTAPEPVADIGNRTIPGPGGDIPVRIYTPEGSGPFPALVYFHGGGWVVGDLEAAHSLCTGLANHAHAIVVSVDYRLAPEHRFPAAVEDCFAATEWVARNAALLNIDPERIAVGGDSAGGNLAAVVALMARDRGAPRLVFQLLLYPTVGRLGETPSYRDNGDGYFLTRDLMVWFSRQYMSQAQDKDDWRVSPFKAADLSGLPPSLIITAEYDPLRDEGEAYGARLVAAGNTVTMKRYAGQIHAFAANFAGAMYQGKQAQLQCQSALRQAFRGGWEPRVWL
jgi:acetyl esterase